MKQFIAWLLASQDGERAPITHFTDACCRFTGLASHHSVFKDNTRRRNIGNDGPMADEGRSRVDE